MKQKEKKEGKERKKERHKGTKWKIERKTLRKKGRKEKEGRKTQRNKNKERQTEGKKNTAADALSRNIGSPETNSKVYCLQSLTTLDNELLYTEQRKDNTWKQIIDYLEGKTQQCTQDTEEI